MSARFSRLVGVGALALALATGSIASTATAAHAPTQAAPVQAKGQYVEVATSITGKTSVKVNGRTPTAVASIPYFQGWRYAGKGICVWDVQNSSAYDVGWEANTFEAAGATVNTTYRTAAQGCSGIVSSNSQVLRVEQYDAADGNCAKHTGWVNEVALPQNVYYHQVWNATVAPTAWVNLHYAVCTTTATNRQHAMGSGMGQVFGLGNFSDDTTMAVMNTLKYDVTAGAWAHDRNRLNLLMNPQ